MTVHEQVFRVGPYLLVRPLGRGSVAEVYKAAPAAALEMHRELAVKLVLPSFAGDPSFVQAYLGEAGRATGLSHPNIVRVYEANAVGDSVFIATELVAGAPLDRVAHRAQERNIPLSPVFVAQMASHVSNALAAAHGHRSGGRAEPMIHGDVSPTNILISYEGVAKLGDFGLAAAKSQLTQTQAGVSRGKCAYTAPEQVSGETVDGRADLFALGTVMWELLVGRPLFAGRNDFETIRNILQAPIPSPRAENANVPSELEKIVLRCLSRKPSERFASATELSRELARWLGNQPTAEVALEQTMQACFQAEIDDLPDLRRADSQAVAAILEGQQAARSASERPIIPVEPEEPVESPFPLPLARPDGDEVTRPWRPRRSLGIDGSEGATGEMPALQTREMRAQQTRESNEQSTREMPALQDKDKPSAPSKPAKEPAGFRTTPAAEPPKPAKTPNDATPPRGIPAAEAPAASKSNALVLVGALAALAAIGALVWFLWPR